MKPAYIWTREHSPERLRMLDDLRWTWEYLFGNNGKRGHYGSIQWIGERWYGRRHTETFQGIVDGRNVTVHLGVVTARAWYARELYLRALARTRARYPDFDAHRFVDGDRIGERRIEFLNERHALSRHHLYTALWETAEESNPVVHEACLFEPCGRWGSPVAAASEYEDAPHADHVRVTVVRNVKEAKDADLAHVIDDLKAGRRPVVDSSDLVAFTFDDIRDGLVELSNPELVLLNWDDAIPELTQADEALWKAAYALDGEGMERALADGANANSIRRNSDNVLSSVIEGWGDYRYACNATEEKRERDGIKPPERTVSHAQMLAMLRRLLDAGAHPDFHNFNQCPAIVNAALAQDPDIAALLLDYGADPNIRPFWDDGLPAGWPAAWDYASTDGFSIGCELGAREVYYEMIKRQSSPLFELKNEDEDRREAQVPDCLRHWYPKPYPFGQAVKSNENRPMSLSEKDAATAFARAWNRLDPEPFLTLLAPDAHYASQWVFEELETR